MRQTDVHMNWHSQPCVRACFFGRNVSRLRALRGLTQDKLAEKAEIDRSYLQRIEKGTSNPTIETAVRLSRALNCSWDDLLRELFPRGRELEQRAVRPRYLFVTENRAAVFVSAIAQPSLPD